MANIPQYAFSHCLPERIARHDEDQHADQHRGQAVFDRLFDVMRLDLQAFARPLLPPAGLRADGFFAAGLPDFGGSMRSSWTLRFSASLRLMTLRAGSLVGGDRILWPLAFSSLSVSVP